MEFIVFADSPAGAALAEFVNEPGTGHTVVAHPSGRPWVVGTWRPGELVTATSGMRSVMLLGCPLADPDELRAHLDRTGTLDALDRLAAETAGSFHLLASVDGRVRAQGAVSATRQIFHAHVRETTVLADRPTSLARLSGAGLDESSIGLHLLSPRPPWPLGERCSWRGVHPVPPDSYLIVEPDDSSKTVRWWTPPEPSMPLAEGGAELVRAALTEAVAARTRLTDHVSADLSGGMDSTSIAFILARDTGPWLTSRFEPVDPANDDAVWAAEAASALTGLQHLVMPRDSLPMNLAGALTPDPDIEGPYPFLRTRGRTLAHAQQLAARGVTDHLTGHGGDELFYVLPSADHSLARQHPFRYLPHLRTNRTLRRWTLRDTMRYLYDNTSYTRWLRDGARDLTNPQPAPFDPAHGWGEPPRLPAWTTPAGVEANRILQDAAAPTAPLSPLRAQHTILDGVRVCGRAVRRMNEVTSRCGVTWHAPFLDDRVIEAAMSIRIEDRIDANRYKPVLRAAMHGIVPARVLGRGTKGEFSADLYAGLHRYKGDLTAQCADMELARLGLVDTAKFRSALLAPHPAARTLLPMMRTLACEAWLRGTSGRSSSTVTAATEERR